MSSGPTNLFDLAVTLRSAIAAEFTTDGVSLPDRQEITGYQVVGDCEKLAITWDRVWAGIPGAAETPVPVNAALTRVATFTVFIFRRVWVPVGEGLDLLQAAPVEDLEADAQLIMTDAYTLHRGIVRARNRGEFLGFCDAMSIGAAEPIPVDGGMSGTTMQLVANLV